MANLKIKFDDGSTLSVDSAPDGGLVKAGAKEQLEKVVGAKDMAGKILDLVESFSHEVDSRDNLNFSKLSISFGVAAGGEAGIKLVNVKASSFLTVQIDMGKIESS